MIEQLLASWPLALVVAGVALLLYGQRDRLAGAWTWLRGWWRSPGPAPPEPDGGLTAAQRFALWHSLRLWCSKAGRMTAVKALDETVLPAIVKEESEP